MSPMGICRMGICRMGICRMGICRLTRGPDSMKCMHMISRDGGHSDSEFLRGGGSGSTAIWKISEISSNLVP